MRSEEIREKYLSFFEQRDHSRLPSASLVPQNDPSVLFNTAGMQPLVPYLLGEPHPEGKRLVNYQKCLRTNDIDEVGDSTHLTFFEMLGNWSLGEYFKQDSIQWSYQLLTDKNEGFGLDPNRIYVSVFAGDDNAPADQESARIWQSVGVPENRIFYLPASENWWPEPKPDDTASGPCGPDTEIFYDLTGSGLGQLSREDFLAAGDRQDLVEIWNNVFMEYQKENGRVIGKLEQQNVDTGMGLERMAAVLQGVENVFETDLFTPIIQTIRLESDNESKLTADQQRRAERIVADHIRAGVFIIVDGVRPANSDAGYILRRLLRRAIQYADQLSLPAGRLSEAIAQSVIDKYQGVYPVLIEQADEVRSQIEQEEVKFRQALQIGLKEFQKLAETTGQITGAEAFRLFSTYGMPLEMIEELSNEQSLDLDKSGFTEAYRQHQEASRQSAGGRFKGGLAGSGDQREVEYHTATHLLNAALREILGQSVVQRGSNITSERLRFDFAFYRKVTPEELQKIEQLVNSKIEADLPVSYEELSLDQAFAQGAVGVFGENYPDTVKVYTIGSSDTEIFSQEICGGPHVERTGSLGHLQITKEEAVSSGVRRIKAILT